MNRKCTLSRTSVSLVVLATLAALGQPANAALVFYSSRPLFEAANPGLPLEDFEEAAVADGAIAAMPNPLDKATDNGIFSTGDILDGLRVSTPDTDDPAALAIPGAGFSGIVPSKSVYGNFLGTSLDATFYNGGVYAVGLDVLSWETGSTRLLSVYGSSGLLGSTPVAVSTVGTFFGVVSTDPIDHLNASGFSGLTVGFDNIEFGAAGVPEPSSLLLLGVGLVGLAKRRRAA